MHERFEVTVLTLSRPRAPRGAPRAPSEAAIVHVFPPLAASAVELLRRPATRAAVGAVLESDPALAAAADTADLHAALARLGPAAVRRRAVKAAVHALRRQLPGAHDKALGDAHALAVAVAAEALADASGPGTPLPAIEAWAAGALLDVGALARSHTGGTRSADGAVDAEAAGLTGLIMRAWGLPLRMTRAVAGLHGARDRGAALLGSAQRVASELMAAQRQVAQEAAEAGGITPKARTPKPRIG